MDPRRGARRRRRRDVWLDVVGGDWAANAAVLSLTVLAIASIVAGLKSVFGEAGAALGG